MSQRKFWTEDEIKILREMKSEGKQNKEIGKIVNRSAANVFAKAKELGLKNIKAWTPERDREIQELVNKGYGVCDLSRHFGKSRKTIRLKLEKMGLLTIARKSDLERQDLIKNGKRKCFLCNNIFLDTPEFFYQKRKCRQCCKNRSTNQRLEMHKNTDLEKILKQRLYSCNSRRSRYEMEYNIDIEFLINLYNKQKGLCFYSGTILDLSIGKIDSLSIDRINSDRGYTRDNVVLCRKDINLMKLEMSKKQFLELCKIIADYNF